MPRLIPNLSAICAFVKPDRSHPQYFQFAPGQFDAFLPRSSTPLAPGIYSPLLS